jgi:bacillithiol biosynthesis cysteine-adding enzyme BshC
MFKLTNISFEKTKALTPLVFDYINKKEELNSFYEFFSDRAGFSEIIKNNPYEKLDRETLCNILSKQSKLVNNTNSQTVSNITRLTNNNVYTITTGHQLCLFTGPLYFIYKIFSAINLAEELSRLFPENAFVPVYWMATEDHDFEEVNHFNIYGKTIKWDSSQTGMAGDFKTSELHNVLSQFKEIIGNSPNSNYLIDLFERSYLGNNNLKDATRFLVNELFGKYGLIIADGNDADFKMQIKNILKKDIFENIPFSKVSETIDQLQNLKHEAQVKPREINCFYVEPGLRARIEKDGGNYKIVGTEKKFSKPQLENIIEHETDRISPNVVLRPLYQQTILPNIAYVGGPGEIAYWLEYKKMFKEFNVQFPVLTLRNFITVIDKPTQNKIEKLGFKPEDFFSEETELIKNFQVKENKILGLGEEERKLSEIYSSIKEKIEVIDKTLVSSSQAEEQKALKGLEMIMQKANRALKQRSETEINQIKAIKQKLFPKGIPQERHENFSVLYSNWGETFLDFIKENIEPLNFSHTIISEI